MWEHLAVEELVVQGEVEHLDAQRLELGDAREDRVWAADEAAREALVRVQHCQRVRTFLPHALRTGNALAPQGNDGGIDAFDHFRDLSLGSIIRGPAKRDGIKDKTHGSA